MHRYFYYHNFYPIYILSRQSLSHTGLLFAFVSQHDSLRPSYSIFISRYCDYKANYISKHCDIFRNGFNLLLHGLGSKRSVIDQFRTTMFSKFVQLVVNGFFPSITIKNVSYFLLYLSLKP